MTAYLNIRGQEYDDSEPCYFTTLQGDMLWNRVSKKWQDAAGMLAKAIQDGHTWQPREIGIPSLNWQLRNLTFDFSWGPGLDSTDGLASEAVTNGDAWAGASTGSGTDTPPTGWTLDPGTTCQNFSGTLNIYADPVLGGGMRQTLTLTPGEYYVAEILVEVDTTPGCRVALDGVSIPLGVAEADGGSAVKSFSFLAPASGSVEIAITLSGGAIASIGHIRVFLESELTGSGSAIGGGVDPDPIHGPYTAGSTTFWVNSTTCQVGFDLDADPDPDIWMTGTEVCASDIDTAGKMGINRALISYGCDPLPCAEALAAKPKAKPKAKAEPAAKPEAPADDIVLK